MAVARSLPRPLNVAFTSPAERSQWRNAAYLALRRLVRLKPVSAFVESMEAVVHVGGQVSELAAWESNDHYCKGAESMLVCLRASLRAAGWLTEKLQLLHSIQFHVNPFHSTPFHSTPFHLSLDGA